MNYFRCTVGGSGKGNTVTVTCAEEFAGLTITLAKTGKTYTKTCPSTAPYVVTFYGVENGTYTVSGTVDGQTYSETVIVQDISCVLNYGFNWKIWVDTASQLDSSDYDSLDEVLADEKALRELFLEHACVDYMAESTSSNEDLETIINNDLCAKWINLSDYALDYLYANEVIADLMDEADKYFYGEWALMPQVPTMTSNTAPLGVAFASSENTNTAAYNAFTDASGSLWSSDTNGSAGSYIGYEFVNPISISYAQATNRSDSASAQSIKDCKLQYYDNDNDSWQDASDVVTLPQGGSGVVNANGVYSAKKWRIYGISNYGDARMSLTRLQFYAWAPKGNVPVMTANTAPYGEAIASGETSGNSSYRAFDQSQVGDDCWYHGTTDSCWLGYKSANPICLKAFDIQQEYATPVYFNNYKVQGSNDGTTWEDITNTYTEHTGTPGEKYYHVIENNDKYYLYHRFYFPSASAVQTAQLYGRELKVSVPVMTSNTAPYGTASKTPSTSTTYPAWKAFDGDDATFAETLPSQATNAASSIVYRFINPIRVKAFAILQKGVGASNPTITLKLEGSNDGTNYTTIYTNSSYKITTETLRFFSVSTANNYLYLRVWFSGGTRTSGNYWNYVNTLQFYGLDYSEKEFEVGTTKKWLYDHGVELETLETALGTGATASNDGETYNLVGGTSSGQMCGVLSSQNLSSHSIARAKVGDMVTNIGICCGSSLSPISSIYNAGYNVFDSGNGNLPNNIYLDISSINEIKYIGAYVGNNAKASLKELWLE